MAKVLWNAILIINDYHVLLLDYHYLALFMGLKLKFLAVLYWNYVVMECRDMHEDFKGQQEHRQARHICPQCLKMLKDG